MEEYNFYQKEEWATEFVQSSIFKGLSYGNTSRLFVVFWVWINNCFSIDINFTSGNFKDLPP